jgi:transposase
MRPEIRRDGDTLRVRVDWQGDLGLLRSFWGWGNKLRLTAYLPRGVRATVRADAGHLRARDLLDCELSLNAEGRRTCWGGRAPVRSVLYMATVVAATHNPVIRAVYKRLTSRGKLVKLAVVACMRKLLTMLNAMVRDGRTWTPPLLAEGAKNS